MVDSILFPWSGRTILTTVDGETVPVSGAQLEVFDAGTTNQQTVYTDAALTTPAANPVVANNAGVVPLRFLGTNQYKITFEDSNDAPLAHYATWDSVVSALDTSGFLTGSVSPTRPITNVSTNTTLVEANDGQHINADATGGSFTVTLRSAVSMGNGNDVVVKHSGTANVVTVSATQTIDGKSSFLLNPGDAATFRSDGGNFSISEAYNFTNGIVTITYAAAVTPDFTFPTDTDYLVTLTGGLTINAPTSPRVGQRGTFTLIQDVTGGHVTTFNSAYNQTGGFSLNTDANAINKINFHVRETGEIDLWLGNQVVQTDSRVLLDTVTATSGTTASSSSIDQTYQDLEIEYEGLSSSAVHQLFFKLSTNNNVSFLTMSGIVQGSDGGAAGSNTTTSVSTGISLHLANENAAAVSKGRIRIQNYTQTSTPKVFEGVVTTTGGAASPGGLLSGTTDSDEGAINGVELEIDAGAFDDADGVMRVYGVRA